MTYKLIAQKTTTNVKIAFLYYICIGIKYIKQQLYIEISDTKSEKLTTKNQVHSKTRPM